jgi:hypothetical protein
VRSFTHGGQLHLLGRSEFGYGIWLVGRELEEPLYGFPGTDEGWQQAWAEFVRLEPHAQPLAPTYAPSYGPPSYGQPAFPVAPYAEPGHPVAGAVPPAGNGMATTGGTLGIVGAALSLIPFAGIVIGLVMGVLAIIFSSIGMGRAGNLGGAGKGMAVTGLVLGILTVVFKLIPGVNLL